MAGVGGFAPDAFSQQHESKIKLEGDAVDRGELEEVESTELVNMMFQLRCKHSVP